MNLLFGSICTPFFFHLVLPSSSGILTPPLICLSFLPFSDCEIILTLVINKYCAKLEEGGQVFTILEVLTFPGEPFLFSLLNDLRLESLIFSGQIVKESQHLGQWHLVNTMW